MDLETDCDQVYAVLDRVVHISEVQGKSTVPLRRHYVLIAMLFLEIRTTLLLLLLLVLLLLLLAQQGSSRFLLCTSARCALGWACRRQSTAL